MKCTLCDQNEFTPYHVTEPDATGKWHTAHLCENCAKEYLADSTDKPIALDEKYPDSVLIDISHISTPDELIELITQYQSNAELKPPCPQCGLTLFEFDKKGRFGCSKCYTHFTERMEELVYPYHGAKRHNGKSPKSLLKTNVERLKTLKLKMAHAIEYEDYENAAIIQKEIDSISGL